MKTIKTHNNKELIVVEVPEDASEFWLSFDAICFKLPNRFDWIKRNDCFIENYTKSLQYTSKILGKLSELSKEDCFDLINKSQEKQTTVWHYFNYLEKDWSFDTAKESLISLLQSQGVDTNKNLLILEKI